MASRTRLAGARDRARKPVLFGVKYISILNQRTIAKPRCKIARAINILFFERSYVKGMTKNPNVTKEIEITTGKSRKKHRKYFIGTLILFFYTFVT